MTMRNSLRAAALVRRRVIGRRRVITHPRSTPVEKPPVSLAIVTTAKEEPLKEGPRRKRTKPPTFKATIEPWEEEVFLLDENSDPKSVRAAAAACAQHGQLDRAIKLLTEFWRPQAKDEVEKVFEEIQAWRLARSFVFPTRAPLRRALSFDVALKVVAYNEKMGWSVDEQTSFRFMVAGIQAERYKEVAEYYDKRRMKTELAVEQWQKERTLETALALAMSPKDDGRGFILRVEAAQRAGEWTEALRLLENKSTVLPTDDDLDTAVRMVVETSASPTNIFRCARLWIADLSRRHLLKREDCFGAASRPGNIGHHTLTLSPAVVDFDKFVTFLNREISLFGLILSSDHPDEPRLFTVAPWSQAMGRQFRRRPHRPKEPAAAAEASSSSASQDEDEPTAAPPTESSSDSKEEEDADDEPRDEEDDDDDSDAETTPMKGAWSKKRTDEEKAAGRRVDVFELAYPRKKAKVPAGELSQAAIAEKYRDKCHYQFRWAASQPGTGSAKLVRRVLRMYNATYPCPLTPFERGTIIKYMSEMPADWDDIEEIEQQAAKVEGLFEVLIECEGSPAFTQPKARLEVFRARCRLTKHASRKARTTGSDRDEELFGILLDNALEFFDAHLADVPMTDDDGPYMSVKDMVTRAYNLAIVTAARAPSHSATALRLHERARERGITLIAAASVDVVAALARRGEVDAAITLGIELADEAHGDDDGDTDRKADLAILLPDIYAECRDAELLTVDGVMTSHIADDFFHDDQPRLRSRRGRHVPLNLPQGTTVLSAHLATIPLTDCERLLEALVTALDADDSVDPPYCRADTDLVLHSLELNQRWRDALDVLCLLSRAPPRL